MWEAYSRTADDSSYGVGRTIVNSKGLFQYEKYPKVFRSYEAAKKLADKLNDVA